MGQAKKLWMEMEERGDWPSASLQAKDVCACHFEDEYLQKMVFDKGHNGTCSYCGEKDVVRNMYDLGEDIAWRVGLYFVDPINADLMLSTDFYDDDDEVIPGFKRVGDFVVPEENTVYESTDEICSIWDFILITMN